MQSNATAEEVFYRASLRVKRSFARLDKSK